MLKAGVVGWPVSHSLSPRLHSYWLETYGIAGEYIPYPVTAVGLPAFIAGLRNSDISGVNLTIPHKETVIALLDEVDEIAASIGAVNTVVVRDGKLYGSNTDLYGFTENIFPHVKATGKAVVLGAGGAAKSVCRALQNMGFARIVVLNRTEDRAQAMISELKGEGLATQRWQERSIALGGADLLVNTTSLGLKNSDALDIDLSSLPKNALVTDIVYNPLITPLLAQAQLRGNPTVDGLGMLMYQAVPGFEAWFGVRPEVTAELKAHLLEKIS